MKAVRCNQHMNLAENEVMRNGKNAFSSQQITLFIAYAHAHTVQQKSEKNHHKNGIEQMEKVCTPKEIKF